VRVGDRCHVIGRELCRSIHVEPLAQEDEIR
jgi:hypothetical protein